MATYSKTCLQHCAVTIWGGYWYFVKIKGPFHVLVISMRRRTAQQPREASKQFCCIWSHEEVLTLWAFRGYYVQMQSHLNFCSEAALCHLKSRLTVWAAPCFSQWCTGDTQKSVSLRPAWPVSLVSPWFTLFLHCFSKKILKIKKKLKQKNPQKPKKQPKATIKKKGSMNHHLEISFSCGLLWLDASLKLIISKLPLLFNQKPTDYCDLVFVPVFFREDFN